MSSGVVLSPNHAINKTRNAILRMKKCSPELRTVLRQGKIFGIYCCLLNLKSLTRQLLLIDINHKCFTFIFHRCQERIQNDRLRILHTFRKIKVQDSFRVAFGNILKEEWKNIDDESSKTPVDDLNLSTEELNLDEKLELEELLEKELLLEHEDWLLQLYEELSSEYMEESEEVVCPLCCSGYLKQIKSQTFKRTLCTKCTANFLVEKSLLDLQTAIFESIAAHDRQCSSNSSFVSVSKNENENNLCIVCHSCSHLNIIE